MFLSRKFANTRSTKALRDYFALPKSPPTSATLGPGWHTRGSWGHQGVPGGSRIPPPPNRVIKQQNNDPKPWFKVPKVCPDPKRGGIYSFMRHLGSFGCSKTAISSEKANLWKTGFLEKNHTHTLHRVLGAIFRMVWQFSTYRDMHMVCGKLPKHNFL